MSSRLTFEQTTWGVGRRRRVGAWGKVKSLGDEMQKKDSRDKE